MFNIADFKKFHLDGKNAEFIRGGYGGHVGCVDCDGSTTYCPDTDSCKTKDCTDGSKAKECD